MVLNKTNTLIPMEILGLILLLIIFVLTIFKKEVLSAIKKVANK